MLEKETTKNKKPKLNLRSLAMLASLLTVANPQDADAAHYPSTNLDDKSAVTTVEKPPKPSHPIDLNAEDKNFEAKIILKRIQSLITQLFNESTEVTKENYTPQSLTSEENVEVDRAMTAITRVLIANGEILDQAGTQRGAIRKMFIENVDGRIAGKIRDFHKDLNVLFDTFGQDIRMRALYELEQKYKQQTPPEPQGEHLRPSLG